MSDPVNTPGERIADIEILRAVAVLYVMLHHANGVLFTGGSPIGRGFYDWFGGWVGVDLFFVISGFVIARVLMPRIAGVASPRAFLTEAGAFWIRRAFRLLPLAWFWLAAVLVLAAFFNESRAFGSMQANLHATVAGVLQFANWRFATSFGQFEYGASFVYWSLSLEEQFYIVLPLIMVIFRARLAWVMAALVVLQIGVERGFMGMAFRTDGLCLGVLLAIFSRHEGYAGLRSLVARHRYLAGMLAGILAMAVAVLGSREMQDFGQRVGAIALVSTLIVAIASTDTDVLARPAPAWLRSALLWTGSRSYALYLLHVPTYFMMRELAFRNDVVLADWPWLTLLATALAIALQAEASFRWIEAPWRMRGRRVAQAYLRRRARPESELVECSR